MDIYAHTNYKELLENLMENNNLGLEKKIKYADMAQAARIQSPYLSKVLRGNADLNEDQLFLLCQFFQLNEEQINYVMLLASKNKTTNPERQQYLDKQLIKLINKKKKLASRLTNTSTKNIDPSPEYYLNPIIQIVHQYLFIKEYQNNIDKLKITLGLKDNQFSNILKTLEELKLIKNRGKKTIALSQDLYLKPSSPLSLPHLKLIRQHSLEKVSVSSDDHKVFSATFTASKKSYLKLKESYLKFLEDCKTISSESNPERVYQLNIDMFPWER